MFASWNRQLVAALANLLLWRLFGCFIIIFRQIAEAVTNYTRVIS